MRLLRILGLDGAVAYTFSARLVNILGSTGTVLLIVRFLSPAEQGYYYTLLSLVSLQVVFELGLLVCDSAVGRPRMRSSAVAREW